MAKVKHARHDMEKNALRLIRELRAELDKMKVVLEACKACQEAKADLLLAEPELIVGSGGSKNEG